MSALRTAAPLITSTVIGTSCTFSTRRWAVTTTSPTADPPVALAPALGVAGAAATAAAVD